MVTNLLTSDWITLDGRLEPIDFDGFADDRSPTELAKLDLSEKVENLPLPKSLPLPPVPQSRQLTTPAPKQMFKKRTRTNPLQMAKMADVKIELKPTPAANAKALNAPNKTIKIDRQATKTPPPTQQPSPIRNGTTETVNRVTPTKIKIRKSFALPTTKTTPVNPQFTKLSTKKTMPVIPADAGIPTNSPVMKPMASDQLPDFGAPNEIVKQDTKGSIKDNVDFKNSTPLQSSDATQANADVGAPSLPFKKLSPSKNPLVKLPTNPFAKKPLKSLPNVKTTLPDIEAESTKFAGAEGAKESPFEGIQIDLPNRKFVKAAFSLFHKTGLAKPQALPDLPPGETTIPKQKMPKLKKGNYGQLAKNLPKRMTARGTKLALLKPEMQSRMVYALRNPETRREAAEILGGSKASENAVDRGLQWLAGVQEKDGSWRLDKHNGTRATTAGTGLGVLPFLGAGYSHKKGKYKNTVDKALKWLIKHQKKDGDLFLKGESSQHHMYSHGIASIALCEAYALTQDPKLKAPAQKALDFIIAAQNGRGGWRYRPKQKDSDTSVFGWQVMALKSGQMAGLNVSPNTLQKAKKYLASVEGNGRVGGTFDYTGRGSRPTMTAQGLLCLQLMGMDRNDAKMLAGSEYLMKHLPKRGRESSYYYYHANQVMYHMQGDYWTAWNVKLREMNVKDQVKSGRHAGSWNPRDNWEKTGGRVFSTSLRLLMLEVYYRHLPLYQQLES